MKARNIKVSACVSTLLGLGLVIPILGANNHTRNLNNNNNINTALVQSVSVNHYSYVYEQPFTDAGFQVKGDTGPFSYFNDFTLDSTLKILGLLIGFNINNQSTIEKYGDDYTSLRILANKQAISNIAIGCDSNITWNFNLDNDVKLDQAAYNSLSILENQDDDLYTILNNGLTQTLSWQKDGTIYVGCNQFDGTSIASNCQCVYTLTDDNGANLSLLDAIGLKLDDSGNPVIKFLLDVKILLTCTYITGDAVWNLDQWDGDVLHFSGSNTLNKSTIVSSSTILSDNLATYYNVQ